MRALGAVVDTRYSDREERAYELVLNKFDEMLSRVYFDHGARDWGLVVHDRRVTDTPLKATRAKWSDEKRIQAWTRDWREVAGRVGKLNRLADVPLFADSRATRLVQAADFVCWAVWRFYSQRDDRWIKDMWNRFDSSEGNMHGLIHVHPGFAKRTCDCPPCVNRSG